MRRGTNGAVTAQGLLASLAGGLAMGLVFYAAGVVSPTLWIFESQRAAAAAQWVLIPLGCAAGLVGSVVDSVLGATLQVRAARARMAAVRHACAVAHAPPGRVQAARSWAEGPRPCVALPRASQFSGFNHTTQRVTSTPGPDVTRISGLQCLDNNMVNVLSATLTAALTAYCASRLFGC